MIPHTQTIFVNDPRGIPGDCMRTAVAALLELPTEAVPHFALYDREWYTAFTMWLGVIGFTMRPLAASNVDRECIALGMSPRGVEHVVVWGPEGMLHDPHPSRAGIEPRQFWALDPITPEVLCPECVQGKTGNCIGWTLDADDNEVACAMAKEGTG